MWYVIIGGVVASALVLVPFFTVLDLNRTLPRHQPAPSKLMHGVTLFRAWLAEAWSWKAGLWSLVLPILWIAHWSAFIGHTRWALGRWPHFNERLPGHLLPLQDDIARGLLVVLLFSGCIVAAAGLVGLGWRRWRHVGLYAFIYCLGVAATFGALFLAPGPFLNWFLD